MRKRLFIGFMSLVAIITLSSCGSSRLLIPQATNMVKAVSFEELNLTGKDYEILNRVESTSRIIVELTSDSYTVKDPDGAFEFEFKKDKKTGNFILEDFDGVVRAGYLLSRDRSEGDVLAYPDQMAHRIAIYRIVNLVKEQGGDGIIEPVISTTVEGCEKRLGRTTITYMTSVSGKVVRLKGSK